MNYYPLKLGLKALIKKFPLVVSKKCREIDVLVVSPGGVATTFMINYISQYKKTNNAHDTDGLKHMPKPPLDIKRSGLKVIFITGRPNEVYESLQRRGFVHIQGAKLASILAVYTKGRIQKKYFEMSVKSQEKCWKNRCLEKDIIFIEYNDIWSRIDVLAEFLDVKRNDFVTCFPSRKKRRSKISAPVVK